jgi:hypothetical protein
MKEADIKEDMLLIDTSEGREVYVYRVDDKEFEFEYTDNGMSYAVDLDYAANFEPVEG